MLVWPGEVWFEVPAGVLDDDPHRLIIKQIEKSAMGSKDYCEWLRGRV